MIFLRSSDPPSVHSGLSSTCLDRATPLGISVLATLLALVCVATQLASGQDQQPDNQEAVVRGTVVNAVTSAPIPRALVYSVDNRFAMLTDGEGHFEFTLPKITTNRQDGMVFNQFHERDRGARTWLAGVQGTSLWLMARKPGFLDDPNGSARSEGSPGTEMTISLMPEALIKGRVSVSATDAGGGASVQLFSRQVQEGMPRWIPVNSTQASSNGEFRFAELLPGLYKIGTTEFVDNDPAESIPGGPFYGFPPVYYPGATNLAVAATIQLAAGQTVQADLSLTRQSYYPVRIPVTNPDPNGAMNIAVSVQGHPGPGYSLGYNAEKHSIEGALPNGNYLVEAATFGQPSSTGTVTTTVAGAQVEGPPMVLIPNSSIVLQVKEQFTSTDWNSTTSWNDGRRTFTLHGPRTYLQARAEPADDFEQHGGANIRPPTGPNDSLILDNLAPGRYWLRLSSSRGYVAAATMGAVDLLHEPLTIAAGSATAIEITMRDDSAEIEGTLTNATAQATMIQGTVSSSPQSWVYCVPLPDSPGQFQQFAVSSDGKFNSPAISPGTYRLLAFRSPQPNLPYRDAEAMRAYETKGQVVQLSAGQKTAVQVQIISPE